MIVSYRVSNDRKGQVFYVLFLCQFDCCPIEWAGVEVFYVSEEAGNSRI